MVAGQTAKSAVEHRLGYANLTGLAAAVLVGVITILGLGWTIATMRDATHEAAQKAVRVTELRGLIAYYNEWLTMSAQMAAVSAEPRWAQRYEEAIPKLDAAIKEAAELATPDVRAAMATTTDEAHRDLVLMERRALALAAQSDTSSARKLLNSPEFSYLSDVYATGIDVFGQDLKTLAERRATDLNNRVWIETSGLGLIVVLLISAFMMVRGRSRLKQALTLTDAVARTDPLTALPNRRQFYQEFDAALTKAGRQGGRCALLLIDLDRFKAANDAYGHLAGDELLQLVAGRLREIAREADLIARLGGDEFALVIRVDSSDFSHLLREPAAVAKRIVSRFNEPFLLAGGTAIQIGASVGVALSHASADAVSQLMHRADVALYRAKADGRGRVRLFRQGMDASVRSRALLEAELRQAVADEHIVPYFQPQVAIDRGHIVGFEMLARWPHADKGVISPAEFIPIAEELGIIGAMTEQLLRQACRAALSWPAHITLACNVSPLQLRDSALPGMIRSVLRETGLPAHRLEVEVTESALLADLALARTLLNELRKLGVSVALDDFGTGYSSLRHLHSLPFDKLKIDGSFVGAMTAETDSAKIVAAVVGLGHSLGLTVIAEGVETAETATRLLDLGCDIGQGWLFGKPVPADMIDLTANWSLGATTPLPFRVQALAS